MRCQYHHVTGRIQFGIQTRYQTNGNAYQLKDVSRRTIEMLQRTRIFKFN